MKKFTLLILATIFSLSGFSQSQTPRQMEYLDRGVTAVKLEGGVFISWRLLGTDPEKVSFNVYRDWKKINRKPITDVTNIIDSKGTLKSEYVVETVFSKDRKELSKKAEVWENQYRALKLNKPADGTAPDSTTYTYRPNDCSVGDIDGDGEYEIILKWDPSNSHDNSQGGYTGNVYLDAYKLDGTFIWRIDLGRNIRAGAHYTQFLVYDFDGDGRSEITCRTAPGTKDALGNDVILPGDDPMADYRFHTSEKKGNTRQGCIIQGPEYLTIFSGATGQQLSTVPYSPERGEVNSWGDKYGNRSDRFLACVAYLDGKNPSIIMCRGYYKRTALTAYDFKGGKLVERWRHDSPTKGEGAYGQGNHQLAVADVDNDGCDEIIYGSCAFNNDGTLLYRTGIGHGDALHVSDLVPERPGLEVFSPHEERGAAYGYEIHDARTGEILCGEKTGSDVGRGLAADIDKKHEGFEYWASDSQGIFNCKGEKISDVKPSINFRVYWDGDLQDELLDGSTISKWNGKTISPIFEMGNIHNSSSCNGTKKTPCLSADILGDWREEVILFNSETNDELIIFTTTEHTKYALYTLMHDPVYRLSVAWQNVAYNQPPHLGFYIGSGIEKLPRANIRCQKYFKR